MVNDLLQRVYVVPLEYFEGFYLNTALVQYKHISHYPLGQIVYLQRQPTILNQRLLPTYFQRVDVTVVLAGQEDGTRFWKIMTLRSEFRGENVTDPGSPCRHTGRSSSTNPSCPKRRAISARPSSRTCGRSSAGTCKFR